MTGCSLGVSNESGSREPSCSGCAHGFAAVGGPRSAQKPAATCDGIGEAAHSLWTSPARRCPAAMASATQSPRSPHLRGYRHDVTDEADYRGFSTAELIALGKLAVMSPRVEWLVQEVSDALGLHERPERFTRRAARAIRTQLRDLGGTPAWASTSAGDIHAWLDVVLRAMNDRDRILHALAVSEAGADGEWHPVLRHRATSTERHPDEVDRLVAELERLEPAGNALLQGLLSKLREGVYLRVYMRDEPGIAHIFAYWLGDRYPERPTNEEINAHWEQFDTVYGTRPSES